MNMKKTLLIAAATTLLAGCSSFYMKASPFYDGPDSAYNEPIEQRVNLWPLLYNRDPSLSVIWPLYTQSADSWFAWPVLTWKDKHDLTCLPLLTWAYGDDFVSLPLLTRKKNDEILSVPLLTWRSRDEWTSLPLLSHYEESTQIGSSGQSTREGEYTFLLGLGGAKFNDGAYSSSWFYPFYADNETNFHSLLYCHEADDSWGVPALLSGSEKTRDGNKYTALLLAGLTTSPDGYAGSHLVPLYVHTRDAFYTIPFGMSDTCWWLAPLWVHLQDAEYPLMGLCGATEKTWWATPAAIGTENGFYGALGLFGWRYDGPNWCIPLYWADPEENQFVSPMAGHVRDYSWWCTPLVSTYQNADGGGFWAWPLFGWSTKPDRERVWWLGGLPLWSREKTATGSSESVLWRLWHKETKKGNVTVDCFPGITYDAHPDGYEKTSFLWRCYRDETIPGKGRNLDVLFIPFSSAE